MPDMNHLFNMFPGGPASQQSPSTSAPRPPMSMQDLFAQSMGQAPAMYPSMNPSMNSNPYQNMFANMNLGQGNASAFPPNMFAPSPESMQQFMQLLSSGMPPTGLTPPAPPSVIRDADPSVIRDAPTVNLEELYASQLQSLQQMGFGDKGKNIRALMVAGGNVQGAIRFMNPGQGNATAFPPNMFAPSPESMQQFMQLMSSGIPPTGLTPPAPPSVPPEEQYASQLQSLQEMGFDDKSKCIRALLAAGGNVQAAISFMLDHP